LINLKENDNRMHPLQNNSTLNTNINHNLSFQTHTNRSIVKYNEIIP